MKEMTTEIKLEIRKDKADGMAYKDLLKKYKINSKMLKLILLEHDLPDIGLPEKPCLDLVEKPDMSLPKRTDNKLNTWVDDYRNPTGFKRV